MLKDNSLCRILEKKPFLAFISSFGITIIDNANANQILKDFEAIIPQTIWGNVDWNQCKNKIALKTGTTQIEESLELLMSKPGAGAQTFYVELTDPDMPLFSTTLALAIQQLETFKTLSSTIFMFDKLMHTIIEVNPLGHITIGTFI